MRLRAVSRAWCISNHTCITIHNSHRVSCCHLIACICTAGNGSTTIRDRGRITVNFCRIVIIGNFSHDSKARRSTHLH